jgi:hypothetical protein
MRDGATVRNLIRRRLARRHERRAITHASLGFLPYAIHLADRSVAVWRPVATTYPAAMARALAVRAACLHLRGRNPDAAAAADECLRFCGRAHGPDTTSDLRETARLLSHAGQREDALALIERIIGEIRSTGTGDLAFALAEYGRELVLLDRPHDAVIALREVGRHTRAFSNADAQARFILFAALDAAGRYDELDRHSAENLQFFAFMARLTMAHRRNYMLVLDTLARSQSAAEHQNADLLLRRQRDIVRRRLARRNALWRAVDRLVRRVSGDRDRRDPDAREAYRARMAAYAGRQAAAVATEAAEVARHRQTGDTYALAEALAVLARACWRTGGQRNAALAAQRESVELTRQLVSQDPAGYAPLLVERLRYFADLAETIGLRTDAQLARTEADVLGAGLRP